MKRLFLLAGFLGQIGGQLIAQGADSTAVDTTSRGYQVGYTIGTYLPVVVILIIVLLIIRRTYKFSGRDN